MSYVYDIRCPFLALNTMHHSEHFSIALNERSKSMDSKKITRYYLFAMHKIIALFCCICMISPCFGQNALIDLYRPFNQSLIALRTDSLFVRTTVNGEITTREIAYTYKDSLLSEWRELHKNKVGAPAIRTKQEINYPDGHRFVLTETYDSLTKQAFTERFSTFGKDPSRPDGYLMEMKQGEDWIPVLQTLFKFDNKGRLLQRLEQQTGVASSEWINRSAWNYDYDSKGRVTEKRLDQWDVSDWKTKNQHRYTYKGGQSQPYSAVWLGDVDGQLTLVDSTLTWYDQTGAEDSTLVFYWIREQSQWQAIGSTLFADKEQQAALKGKTFVRDLNGNWVERNETTFTAGEAIFTDDPQEEMLRSYNTATKEWIDIKRTVTQYKPLDDGHIYGSISTEEIREGNWEETFFAEAWFHKDPFRPGLDTIADRSKTGNFTFAYSCGLPNPYVATRTLAFPVREDLTGNYELKIVSEEGRLIFRRSYDGSGTGYVDTPLAPGFYLVTVSKGGTPVCSQKLVVQ